MTWEIIALPAAQMAQVLSASWMPAFELFACFDPLLASLECRGLSVPRSLGALSENNCHGRCSLA